MRIEFWFEVCLVHQITLHLGYFHISDRFIYIRIFLANMNLRFCLPSLQCLAVRHSSVYVCVCWAPFDTMYVYRNTSIHSCQPQQNAHTLMKNGSVFFSGSCPIHDDAPWVVVTVFVVILPAFHLAFFLCIVLFSSFSLSTRKPKRTSFLSKSINLPYLEYF